MLFPCRSGGKQRWHHLLGHQGWSQTMRREGPEFPVVSRRFYIARGGTSTEAVPHLAVFRTFLSDSRPNEAPALSIPYRHGHCCFCCYPSGTWLSSFSGGSTFTGERASRNPGCNHATFQATGSGKAPNARVTSCCRFSKRGCQ